MIYAIQAGDGGPIKFGVALDPNERLRKLQTGNPAHLRLLACADADHRYEALIHTHLRSGRMAGEWFTPDAKAWAVVFAIEQEHIFGQKELFEHILRSDELSVSEFLNREQAVLDRTLPPLLSNVDREDRQRMSKRLRMARWRAKQRIAA